MNHTYPPEKYGKQLREYIELDKLSFSPEDSRDYVIGRLKERSAKKRAIAEIANTMIREYIEPFEREPENLTPDDIRDLETFIESLFQWKGPYKGQATDQGIAFRIAKILCGYYRSYGDLNKYAFMLDRCIFWEIGLINLHSFEPHPSVYYEDCMELVGRLDELNEDGRHNVLTALSRLIHAGKDGGDLIFPYERFSATREAVVSNLEKPLSAHDKRLLLIMYGNMLDYFRVYCMNARDRGITVDSSPYRDILEDISGFIRELVESGQLSGSDRIRGKYYLLTTGFFLGSVTLDELLDGINDLQRETLESPDPVFHIADLAPLTHVYLSVLYKFSPLPRDEIVRLSREKIREIMPRLLLITRKINNVVLNKYFALFLNAASLTGSFDDFAEVILETTVYADKSLFIHTAMVREMSLAIFDHMIGQTPEFFDGVAGHDAEYIINHKDEMRDLLSDCCMYHDIGKFFVLDIVENSMRRLTDDEFGLIKYHPANFENIYQMNDVQDERVQCIRDCALTHHLWHDGTKGYPNIPQTKNRPFADILAVADSIDAATDFLGRPYNSGKTIDQLIDEFREGAGSRYGPEVVEALSCQEVRDRLQYLITEGRMDINYRIYTTGKL